MTERLSQLSRSQREEESEDIQKEFEEIDVGPSAAAARQSSSAERLSLGVGEEVKARPLMQLLFVVVMDMFEEKDMSAVGGDMVRPSQKRFITDFRGESVAERENKNNNDKQRRVR